MVRKKHVVIGLFALLLVFSSHNVFSICNFINGNGKPLHRQLRKEQEIERSMSITYSMTPTITGGTGFSSIVDRMYTLLQLGVTMVSRGRMALIFIRETYQNNGFSCAREISGGTTYLHCTYAWGTLDNLGYRRCTLTGSGSYISCDSAQTPFDSSILGGATGDDVSNPRIAIDSNGCVLIAFNFEDASEATADEMEIVMVKEKHVW